MQLAIKSCDTSYKQTVNITSLDEYSAHWAFELCVWRNDWKSRRATPLRANAHQLTETAGDR